MSSSPPGWEQYAFGPFRLAADASLLLAGNEPVPLAPKVLQTLRVLVERAGQVVSKDELMNAVWQDTFVEETGLARNISLLRRALGQDGEHWIATVPRVGYRFAAPVRIVHAATTPTRIVRTGPPFVGRARELGRVRDALANAERGQGRLLGLAGEPGIGKTTLATHFVTQACTSSVVGIGRSAERFGAVEPHLPVLEALEAITRPDAVARLLTRVAPTWAALVRPAEAVKDGRAHAGTPERLLRELTQFLGELARQRPVVLLFEDIHWADTATVDVIAHLADRLGDLRILVLLTYRDRALLQHGPPFTHVRAELRAKGLLEELALPLLTRHEVAAYVAQAGTSNACAETSDRVYARSEGNPLFMSALLAYLAGADGDAAGDRVDDGVPDSLRGLITRLLGQTGADQHEVLEMAAMQGVEFDAHVIAQALGRHVLTVEDVLEHVERLHGLVARQRVADVPDALMVRWRFRHALYQAALLDQLRPSRRASLAGRLADVLDEQRGADRSSAGQVALLREVERAHGAAAERFAEASMHATERLAFKDAYDLAMRGVRSLAQATELDQVERDRVELNLTFARLVPWSSWRGYGHPTTEALAARASALADQLGEPRAIARALGMMCFVRNVRAECMAARDAAVRLAALAPALGDSALLINAHMLAQIACHHLGHFADADAHASEVMRLGRDLRPPDRFINVFDPVVASLAESSRNAWITGRLATARVLAEQAVTLGGEVRNPESLAFAWLFHAWLHGYRGDWRECVQSAETGVAIAQDAGTVQTLAWNQCVRGWGNAHMGDVERGRQDLAEGIALSQSIMGKVALPQFRVMMAEVLLLAGALDDARTWVSEALAASEEHDDAYFAAEIHRTAAICEVPGPRLLSPAGHIQRALDVARQQGASFFELRAALTGVTITGDVEPLHRAFRGIVEPEAWADVTAAAKLCPS